jgi:hypothetical protein
MGGRLKKAKADGKDSGGRLLSGTSFCVKSAVYMGGQTVKRNCTLIM